MEPDRDVTWHQALLFALTGERRPELGTQELPDVEAVLHLLPPGQRGAHVVPSDLMDGIAPAHFWAVLAELRRRLAQQTAQPVLADRPLSVDERRLSVDVPPHHG